MVDEIINNLSNLSLRKFRQTETDHVIKIIIQNNKELKFFEKFPSSITTQTFTLFFLFSLSIVQSFTHLLMKEIHSIKGLVFITDTITIINDYKKLVYDTTSIVLLVKDV